MIVKIISHKRSTLVSFCEAYDIAAEVTLVMRHNTNNLLYSAKLQGWHIPHGTIMEAAQACGDSPAHAWGNLQAFIQGKTLAQTKGGLVLRVPIFNDFELPDFVEVDSL